MESIKTFVAGLILMTFTLLFAYAATAQAQFYRQRGRSTVQVQANGIRTIRLTGRTFTFNPQTQQLTEVAGMQAGHADPMMPVGHADPMMPAGHADPMMPVGGNP